jgi:hypothetical protein
MCRFDLPLLEDANAVQVALMKVIQMLGSGRLDHKTAGLMLYALQTASVNLRNTDFETEEVTDIVIDRDTVDATCINGPQWFEEDFDEDEEGEEAETEDEDEEGEEAEEAEEDDAEVTGDAGDAHVDAENAGSALASVEKTKVEFVRKGTGEKKPVTVEEARAGVQRMVREWLSETATKPAETPI